MSKTKTALKWAKKEIIEKPKYVVSGGPCNGYDVINLSDEVVGHYENMWDAINERERLLKNGQT